MRQRIMFSPNDKLADVIHENYALLPVINRFKIDVGFGDKTVIEICTERAIDVNFFLEILNTFHDDSYFPQNRLKDYDVRIIVDYLKATHDYYLNYELREIEKMVHNLIYDDGDGEDKVHIIVRFFDNYKQEVLTHIEDEEVTVFPYVKNLKNALEGQKLTNQQKKLLCDFSITSFEANHSDIDMKLTDLKNLLVKYFPGKPNNYVCNELIFRLARFEKDLKDHARIEDKILVSKVKLLEKELNTKII